MTLKTMKVRPVAAWPEDDPIIDRAGVRLEMGGTIVSMATVDRAVRLPDFPLAIMLTDRKPGWRRSEVRRWLERRRRPIAAE